jgi:GGDEF domain-containing protein
MKKIKKIFIILTILTLAFFISYKNYFEDRQIIAKYYGYSFAYTLDSDFVNHYAILAYSKDTARLFDEAADMMPSFIKTFEFINKSFGDNTMDKGIDTASKFVETVDINTAIVRDEVKKAEEMSATKEWRAARKGN